MGLSLEQAQHELDIAYDLLCDFEEIIAMSKGEHPASVALYSWLRHYEEMINEN